MRKQIWISCPKCKSCVMLKNDFTDDSKSPRFAEVLQRYCLDCDVLCKPEIVDVVEPSPLSFVDAMLALKDGKKVKRKSWKNAVYLTISDSVVIFVISPPFQLSNKSTERYAFSFNDFEAIDWEIMEDETVEKPSPLNFTEAFLALKNGKKIRRPGWAKDNRYLVFGAMWHVTKADLRACDWEIME